MVGSMASNTIIPTLVNVSGATWNNVSKNGNRSTAANKTTPAANAKREYGLLLNPNRKIDFCPRQLKPWNKRARVKVAKAIVVARAAFRVEP